MNKVEIVNTVVSKCLTMRGINGSDAYDFGSSKVYHFADSQQVSCHGAYSRRELQKRETGEERRKKKSILPRGKMLKRVTKKVMTRIQNKLQYQSAMARIEELLKIVNNDTPVEDKDSIELVLLSELVADYEDVHYPIEKPILTDVLKLRMY